MKYFGNVANPSNGVRLHMCSQNDISLQLINFIDHNILKLLVWFVIVCGAPNDSMPIKQISLSDT